ncbi:YitT family protein [[Mycoplasma] anseris]|nr:YitT family protein [[Mycoplasma] anseris]
MTETKKKNKKTKPESYFDLNPYKVNIINVWKKFPKKIFFIFLSAILYNLGVATFLAKAATVASGLSAIVQTLTYTISSISPYFAFLYFAFNLPFLIIFWKKNNRLFMILTFYWLSFQILFQSFLFIKPVEDFFQKMTIYIVNWKSGIKFHEIIPWNVYGQYPIALEYANPTWPILIYAIIGGIAAGTAAGIAWKNSGSTAGSDIIIYYFSRKKKKGVGIVSTVVALIFGSLSILIIFIVEITGIDEIHKPWNLGAFILRCISSIVYIFIYNIFVEILYPKYKKIKVEIYTKKPKEIIAHFQAIKYWHGYNFSNVTSGFNNTETTKIETVALYLEQTMIQKEILKIDANAWITFSTVNKIIGQINTSKVD